MWQSGNQYYIAKRSVLRFRNWSRFALCLIMYILTTLEFPIYNIDFHIFIYTALQGTFINPIKSKKNILLPIDNKNSILIWDTVTFFGCISNLASRRHFVIDVNYSTAAQHSCTAPQFQPLTYTRKNAQPAASCQQAWTVSCCTLWTLLSTVLFRQHCWQQCCQQC